MGSPRMSLALPRLWVATVLLQETADQRVQPQPRSMVSRNRFALQHNRFLTHRSHFRFELAKQRRVARIVYNVRKNRVVPNPPIVHESVFDGSLNPLHRLIDVACGSVDCSCPIEMDPLPISPLKRPSDRTPKLFVDSRRGLSVSHLPEYM